MPPTAVACPHCDRAPRRRWRWLARAACAGGALVTLMACYGAMTARHYPGDYDRDGDGVATDRDCNDADPIAYPGAADLQGDGVDQNCDGADGWADPDAPPPPPAPIATDPAAPPPTDPPPAAIAVDPPS